MKLTTRRRDALGHITEHCRKAAELAAELTQERFTADWRTRYALTLCVQIVGEASTRLGGEFQAAYPQIPWRQIIGIRHHLVHGYDTVDEITLWQTITEDLPLLLTQVENILAEPE